MEEEKRPPITIMGLILISIMIVSLIIYWFIPIHSIEFNPTGNANFTLNQNDVKNMQFYKNMRFPSNKISYKISEDCTLQKKQDMEEGLKILEDKTILDFYHSETPEILVECEQKEFIENGLFIAGEGGTIEHHPYKFIQYHSLRESSIN